jgi:alpha/beta superfamily hydrolase
MIRLFTLVTLFVLVTLTNIFGQSAVGSWYGQLEIQSAKLKINFHIIEENGEYKSSMDSPDQGAFGIPTTKTTFTNNELVIQLQQAAIEYKGEVEEDVIKGTFTQNGQNFTLNLSKKEIKEETSQVRPQDPVKPYSYKSKEVFFINEKANNIKLAGTLTLPENVENPPVVILISGSGPQNRDSEIKAYNHRPFLVLSDYLTKNGIAVLRYDDRGVATSEGTQKGATSADFATDVEAAVNYLKTRKDINTSQIGLVGHSEGGFIAPMVASKRKDVAFIVLLAGTGVDGPTILQTQSRRANELNGAPIEVLDFNETIAKGMHEIVKKETDKEVVKTKIEEYLTNFKKENSDNPFTKSLTDQLIKQQIKGLSSNWITYFIRTNPDQFLSKVTCPVLALNGDRDYQVLSKLNLDGIKISLEKAKNKDVTIMELKGLNHLFQTSTTGKPSEYKEIEETMSPIAMKIVSDWIHKRFQ